MPPMADPLISLAGVRKTFGAHAALAGIDLAIEAGSFVALVGGSGSGKTTALKIINGLVSPDTGEVRVAGEAVGRGPGHLLRRRIGYVFQEIGLFPHMTVAENIAVGPILAGWSKADIAARVSELLGLVALPDTVATRLPAELSGGQRQRVGVARALAAKPSIMLMDEPFGALDPITRDALGRDYKALHAKLGLTTVMVTHDVMEALLLADRIVVLGEGRVLADATPHGLLSGHADPAVRALTETPLRQARDVNRLAASASGSAV